MTIKFPGHNEPVCLELFFLRLKQSRSFVTGECNDALCLLLCLAFIPTVADDNFGAHSSRFVDKRTKVKNRLSFRRRFQFEKERAADLDALCLRSRLELDRRKKDTRTPIHRYVGVLATLARGSSDKVAIKLRARKAAMPSRSRILLYTCCR